MPTTPKHLVAIFLGGALCLVPQARAQEPGAQPPAPGNSGGCSSLLRGHLSWLDESPANHVLSATVVALHGGSATDAEASYLKVPLRRGEGAHRELLVGEGDALFDTREWVEQTDKTTGEEGTEGDHPFDPHDTDALFLSLSPSRSALTVVDEVSDATQERPIVCRGALVTSVFHPGSSSGKDTHFAIALERTVLEPPR